MKQIQSRSLLYFLIVCAVITFRVDNILADQKKTVSPKPAEPTFTVDGMVFLPTRKDTKNWKLKSQNLNAK